MKRNYILIYLCDTWRSKNSMRLYGIFTEKRAITVIRKLIKNGDAKLNDGYKLKDINLYNINNIAEYLLVENVQINEEL